MEQQIPEFGSFRKIPRLSREIVITEKIDGTNGVIHISDDGQIVAGSRNRWLLGSDDNHGFRKWVEANKDGLLNLGPGYHYGEWWGQGINRGYGLKEKRFSLFNAYQWSDELGKRPSCCGVVPVLYRGEFSTAVVDTIVEHLKMYGSIAAPMFMDPEGVVVYHEKACQYFKKTIGNDGVPKGVAANVEAQAVS